MLFLFASAELVASIHGIELMRLHGFLCCWSTTNELLRGSWRTPLHFMSARALSSLPVAGSYKQAEATTTRRTARSDLSRRISRPLLHRRCVIVMRQRVERTLLSFFFRCNGFVREKQNGCFVAMDGMGDVKGLRLFRILCSVRGWRRSLVLVEVSLRANVR